MNSGWEARLEILRRDADYKILSKLKTHGWKSSIVAEVSKGDYIVIEASRGGHRHKIALMYSSGTGNDVYKSLQDQVEHICINGDLHKLESFAFGIKTPISRAADFHQILLEWNKACTEGPFTPEDEESVDDEMAERPKYNRIQSENPLQSVWIHLRQLESVTLAKRSVSRRATAESVDLNEVVVTSKGEGLAFALRNASDYFRSAEGRNMSQRILNLYYGTLAFAFAEMLASPKGPSTLAEIEDSTKQGHGLFTLDGKSDKLEDLVIGVIRSGFYSTYIQFLGHDVQSLPAKKPRKFDELKSDDEFWITFEGLFSKVPDVGDLFINIFESKPGWVVPHHDSEANSMGLASTSSKKTPRSYIRLVDSSGRWVKEDILALVGPISEITQLKKTKSGARRFRAAVDHEGHENFWPVLPTHKSPYIDQALIVPAFKSVNEYRAICLAVLYSLSIIVRYRPSLWRRVQEGDLDYMRVLIEAYLDSVERVLPEQYLGQITGQTVVAKQPGAMF